VTSCSTPKKSAAAGDADLAAWYDLLGYRVQRVGHSEEAYPDLAPLLCTAADFRVYRKTL
jgi:hypothetical protein